MYKSLEEAGKFVARCSVLELNETREESERESLILPLKSPSWKTVTTIFKVYGKIQSNSFSGNYTPCTTSLFTAPRLSSRLLHYAGTKLHSESMKFIEV